MKHDVIALYADGGVIGINPSPDGGTWAWCQVNEDGQRVRWESGVITPSPELQIATVSNNLTEMLALINGLDSLPEGWSGTVYSDSRITLGRVFESWKLNNIPPWLVTRIGQALRRHDMSRIKYVLLDGHPTAAQLAIGVGKRGGPVSEHNVWCDRACGKAARQFKMQQVPV